MWWLTCITLVEEFWAKKKYFGSSEKYSNQQRHDNSVMNIYIQTIIYKTIFHICDKEIADIFPIASCNYKIMILK